MDDKDVEGWLRGMSAELIFLPEVRASFGQAANVVAKVPKLESELARIRARLKEWEFALPENPALDSMRAEMNREANGDIPEPGDQAGI